MPAVISGQGPAIRRAYEDMGLSREKFAELVDLSAKTITNITAPEGGVVSRATAARIAKVLGWRISEVIEDLSDADTAAEVETSRGAA